MGDDITDPKNEKNSEVSPEEKEDEGEDGGMNLLNSDSVTPVRIWKMFRITIQIKYILTFFSKNIFSSNTKQ